MQKITTFLKNRKYLLLMFLVVIVAYWPISFHVFSLKNDSLIYFLPYRYHVSESIQHGFFPWWNPYLYTGIPIHGDIQSGVWNPAVIFISLFTTYDMSVLQWELLLYILLSALGMYKLTRFFGCAAPTSFAAGIAYACSGFMTDSGGLLPWINSAAYLPFVFYYFLRLLKIPTAVDSIKLALALSLLLTTGYPSFFIFAGYVLLAATCFWLLFKKENRWKPLSFLSLSFVLFLLICSPAILSWWDFLPYYNRGQGTSLEGAVSNSFPAFGAISYLLSSAVSKNHEWLQTDISARNASIGLFFLLAFIITLATRLRASQKFILGGVVLTFLFTLGGATPLREWCYRLLPFMDTFRHPANMRVFTTIGIIVLAAPVADRFFAGTWTPSKRFYGVILITGVILLALLIYYFPKSIIFSEAGRAFNKAYLDRLAFADIAVVVAIIQLFFLILFAGLLQRRRQKLLLGSVVLNSVILCSIALPFTFISQVRTSTVNAYLDSFPKNFPTPVLGESVGTAESSDSTGVHPLGYANFYNKKIRIQDHVISPIIPRDYRAFLANQPLRKKLAARSFAYFGQVDENSIKITEFDNSQFGFTTTSNSADSFYLFQGYHPRWTAFIDNSEVAVSKSNQAFLGIAIPAGSHNISFIFTAWPLIRLCMYISILVLLGITVFLLVPVIKKYRSS